MAGSIIGSVAGPVVGGLIGGIGSDKAESQFQAGANAAQQIFTPQPFQGKNSFGAIDRNGKFQLNPFGQATLQKTSRLSNRAFGRADRFNRRDFAARLLEAGNRINDDRENQAFSSLESKLFNQSGISSGTQRQIADFQSDIEDRRFNRALQAEIGANQVGRNLFGDFANALGLVNQFDDRRMAAQAQGLAGAQALAPFAINNPAQSQAGAFRAQNTQDFFDGLGGVIGGGIDAGLSFLGSSSGGGGGGGFFNPGAINFGNNPFVLS